MDDILSGDDNFLLANAPHGDANALIDKLGERYEIVRTSIKKWTVGTPIQAPLDALEIMLKKRPIEPDQVREVIVRMDPRTSVVNNREMPDVCIQHMLAVMLIDKTATFRSAHDKPRMQDPAILRHRAKVRLDPAAPPLLTIVLADGTRLSEDVKAVLGTAENPMTRDQVVAKARELMTPVLGASASAKLCAMFFVQGFSQYTSLPALAARIAAVACQFGPVAISTASMSGRASRSCRSRYIAQSVLP